jgi:hypothetical protein
MYYGIDSNTSTFPTGATNNDFYIGRLGKGTTADNTYFNNTGADAAERVYMYWFLYGPKNDPSYTTSYTTTAATNWGKAQADAAYVAWCNNTKLNKLTIFCDVERESSAAYGWLASSDSSNYTSLNYAVFKGFVDGINAHTSFQAGVYTSQSKWSQIMGSSNSPAYAQVVWGANYPSGSSFNNPPSSMSGCYSINSVTPTIWQYYGGTSGDADIASSMPK